MPSKFLTLVFTDLKGSTSLKAEKGDDAAGKLIARHREHVKRLALAHDGRIIDWAGDGCFLTFETPSAAVLFFTGNTANPSERKPSSQGICGDQHR